MHTYTKEGQTDREADPFPTVPLTLHPPTRPRAGSVGGRGALRGLGVVFRLRGFRHFGVWLLLTAYHQSERTQTFLGLCPHKGGSVH